MDLILHLDRHLAALVAAYGPWIYGLLFAIVFAETGLVVTPFLPGDSLLFPVGALCATGAMQFSVAAAVLLVAAVVGDQCNYPLGGRLGARVTRWRAVNQGALQRAQRFYERRGPMAVVLARFLPLVRTFVPFVAGIAGMRQPRFTAYNMVGGALWVGGLLAAGYLFGNLPFVRDHLEVIIMALVLIPTLAAVLGSSLMRGGGRPV